MLLTNLMFASNWFEINSKSMYKLQRMCMFKKIRARTNIQIRCISVKGVVNVWEYGNV